MFTLLQYKIYYFNIPNIWGEGYKNILRLFKKYIIKYICQAMLFIYIYSALGYTFIKSLICISTEISRHSALPSEGVSLRPRVNGLPRAAALHVIHPVFHRVVQRRNAACPHHYPAPLGQALPEDIQETQHQGRPIRL